MNENRWLRAAGAPKNRVFPPCARGGGGGGGVSSDPGALRPLSKKFWCLKPYGYLSFTAQTAPESILVSANLHPWILVNFPVTPAGLGRSSSIQPPQKNKSHGE